MVKKRKSTVPKIDDGIPKCCFCHQPGLTKESLIHKFMTNYFSLTESMFHIEHYVFKT